MAQNSFFEVDIREFKKSATKFMRQDYPQAVSMFTHILATKVEIAEHRQIRADLDLKSNWIPRNIKGFPRTRGQRRKIEKDILRSHQFIASVSGSERIAFMTGHNEGMTRRTQADWTFGPDRITNMLAIPSKDLQQKNYATKTGKIRDRWYPTTLLKNWQGKNGPKPNKNRKTAFLMKVNNMHMIARRKSKRSGGGIEVLWFFVPQAKIKKDWYFDEAGERAIQRHYRNAMVRAWKKLK